MTTVPTLEITSFEDITIEIKHFFENTPLYSTKQIIVQINNSVLPQIKTVSVICKFPNEIQLFCPSEHCNHTLNFNSKTDYQLHNNQKSFSFLIEYNCKNCYFSVSFAINYSSEIITENDKHFLVIKLQKFGQYPSNAIKIPKEITTLSKRMDLIAAKEINTLFSNGMICEGHGLGIGAFSYYRQIVEIMRDVIFDLIISSLEHNKANTNIINEYQLAKSEHQFDKSMEHIKCTLPDSFKLGGQNPIKLLFKALSSGVHLNDKKDNDCIELAKRLTNDFSKNNRKSIKSIL